MERRCCARSRRPVCSGVHREVPYRAAEAKAVNQIEGNSHIIGIDRHDLIMNLGIVDVTIREVDLACIDIVSYHRRVVDYALAIGDADKAAEFHFRFRLACKTRGETLLLSARGRCCVPARNDRALVEYNVSIRSQVACPGRGVDEIELCGKVQAKLLGNPESETSVRMYQTVLPVLLTDPLYRGMVIVPAVASSRPVSSNCTGPTKLWLTVEGGGPKYERGTFVPILAGAGNKSQPGCPKSRAPAPGPCAELTPESDALETSGFALAVATGRFASMCRAIISVVSGALVLGCHLG